MQQRNLLGCSITAVPLQPSSRGLSLLLRFGRGAQSSSSPSRRWPAAARARLSYYRREISSRDGSSLAFCRTHALRPQQRRLLSLSLYRLRTPDDQFTYGEIWRGPGHHILSRDDCQSVVIGQPSAGIYIGGGALAAESNLRPVNEQTWPMIYPLDGRVRRRWLAVSRADSP